jgi:hypothetical protein
VCAPMSPALPVTSRAGLRSFCMGRKSSANSDLGRGVPVEAFRWPALRPAHVRLGTEKGQLLAPLDCAMRRFAQAMQEWALATDAAASAANGALPGGVAALA